jgi:hypothetical protein
MRAANFRKKATDRFILPGEILLSILAGSLPFAPRADRAMDTVGPHVKVKEFEQRPVG